ncbi:MAG TPA: CcdC protein domain-containing protein, partial [Sphingomicrobium sp.]|nr:CcdC protein domain-containing protein [Sphingomicrobium sp.]
MQQHGGNWLTAIVPFVIIAVVIGLRLRSMSRERPLKTGTLWIVPAVYLLLVAWMLFALPPTPVGWALVAVGAVVGAMLGWHRGKLIRIERNDDGELRQQASPLAMLLLVALIVLKLGARA